MFKKRKNKKLALSMKKNIKSLIIVLSIFIVSGFLICVNSEQTSAYNFWGDSGLDATAEQTGYINDQGGSTWFKMGVPEVIGKVIGIALTFLGALFLILMIYGGYIWMMARGNEEETNKAKSIIKNALIGLIIVLATYVISEFLLQTLI